MVVLLSRPLLRHRSGHIPTDTGIPAAFRGAVAAESMMRCMLFARLGATIAHLSASNTGIDTVLQMLSQCSIVLVHNSPFDGQWKIR